MGFQLISRIDTAGAHPAAVTSNPTGTLGGALIMSPGRYAYNGIVYDMTEEGFYSFFNAGYLGVYDGGPKIVALGGGTCNVERLMAAMAWCTRYGREDEGYTPAQLTANVIRLRTAALRCEPTIDWALSICATLGVTARKVRFITAQTPNGVDDGHVALEAKIAGVWKLFDIAGDVCFRSNSNLLSMNEVAAAGVANVTTERMAPTESGPTGWSGTALQTEQYFNQVFRFGADAWRQRIFQCIGIDHQGEVWWKLPPGSPPALTTYVLGLQSNYRVKDAATWDAAFYP